MNALHDDCITIKSSVRHSSRIIDLEFSSLRRDVDVGLMSIEARTKGGIGNYGPSLLLTSLPPMRSTTNVGRPRSNGRFSKGVVGGQGGGRSGGPSTNASAGSNGILRTITVDGRFDDDELSPLNNYSRKRAGGGRRRSSSFADGRRCIDERGGGGMMMMTKEKKKKNRRDSSSSRRTASRTGGGAATTSRPPHGDEEEDDDGDDDDDDDNSEDSACCDARLKNMVHVSLEDDCNAREEGEYLLRRQRLRHTTISVVSEGVVGSSSGGGVNGDGGIGGGGTTTPTTMGTTPTGGGDGVGSSSDEGGADRRGGGGGGGTTSQTTISGGGRGGSLPPTSLSRRQTSSSTATGGGGGKPASVISNGGKSDFTRSSGGRSSRTSSSSRRRRNSRGRRSMGASGFFAAANNNNNTAGAGVLPRLARDGISTSLSPGPASSSRSDVGGSNGDDNPSSSCGGDGHFDEMGIITNLYYPPITIPLSDILNVDEDRPTASTAATSSTYRIFLLSSTQGCFELTFESNNSHDVCMAFLLAHLPHDRIVKSSRRQQQKGGLPIESFNTNTKQHGENNKLRRVSSATGVGMMLRTMVLTPTEQLLDDDNNIVLTPPPPPRIVTSLDDTPPPLPIPSDDYPRIRSCPSSPTHKISISSSTLSSCRSNAIDKLQAKVIQQHLRDYESSSVDTPLTRLVHKGKELADRVRNNILDCQLCCVDTTTESPLAAAAAESRDDGGSALLGGGGGIIINDGTMGMKYQMKDDHYYNKSTNKKKSSSPDTETLRNRGIGGLSFEVESCSGLSWERSVCDS